MANYLELDHTAPLEKTPKQRLPPLRIPPGIGLLREALWRVPKRSRCVGIALDMA